MQSLSPNPMAGAAQQSSSSPQYGHPGGSVSSSSSRQRPATLKRHSSASSAGRRAGDILSPGSHDGQQHLLQQHRVKPARHARVVLPRNQSSGRNLARLAQQATEKQKRAAVTHRHSHEGDTEIRLPGSLDDGGGGGGGGGGGRPPPPPPTAVKRNMTSYQLPRTHSHSKLKKNLSHGQLHRLNSGKNLAAMAHRAGTSPGTKAKQRRHRSAEIAADLEDEKDLHEQEIELMAQQKATREAPKKAVGFAVGSAGSSSEGEVVPDMEGSGLQEDEWTEDSNSASPYSTRQNTANNSRRASVVSHDKTADKPVFAQQTWQVKNKDNHHLHRAVENAHRERANAEASAAAAAAAAEVEADVQQDPDEEVETADEDVDSAEGEDPPSPGTTPHDLHEHSLAHEQSQSQAPRVEQQQKTEIESVPPLQEAVPKPEEPLQTPRTPSEAVSQPEEPKPDTKMKSPLAAAKLHSDPTRKLLSQRTQQPVPALVSNVSALDDVHSARESPAGSTQSSRSNLVTEGSAEQDPDELVSRFLPSASHPSIGSGPNTAYSTPKQGGFHTPEEDSALAAQNRARSTGFHVGPVSPGSTISASSGAATPAAHRSRIDMKMALEKHQAKIESEVERQPLVPVHVYDRRNESLKSWLNMSHAASVDGKLASSNAPSAGARVLGPELFQGRFKAVNQELKVVQKYQDPLRAAVTRLRQCKGSKLAELHHQQTQRSKSQKPGTSHQQQQPPTAASLRLSKSAVALSATRNPSKPPTSASPPSGTSASPAKSGLASALSASDEASHKRQQQSQSLRGASHPKRAVSFKVTPAETREIERDEDEDEDEDEDLQHHRLRQGEQKRHRDGPASASESSSSAGAGGPDIDAIARQMWMSFSKPQPASMASPTQAHSLPGRV